MRPYFPVTKYGYNDLQLREVRVSRVRVIRIVSYDPP